MVIHAVTMETLTILLPVMETLRRPLTVLAKVVFSRYGQDLQSFGSTAGHLQTASWSTL